MHLLQRCSGRPFASEVVEQIAQDSSAIAFRRSSAVQTRLAGSQSAKSDRDRHRCAASRGRSESAFAKPAMTDALEPDRSGRASPRAPATPSAASTTGSSRDMDAGPVVVLQRASSEDAHETLDDASRLEHSFADTTAQSVDDNAYRERTSS